MKKIIIITGSELRHSFLRMFLGSSKNFKVIKTYCESEDANLKQFVRNEDANTLRSTHLIQREQTERDFFELFCKYTEDHSNPQFIKKGDINLDQHVEEIKALNPDLIISYGCSIIKPPLIDFFGRRFINIHLGLSPYYRGSGTNYWPFVNKEMEYIGVTFMYIDKGVDTGKVFHQIRPRIYYNDDVHKIGNRLIYDMAVEIGRIVEAYDDLKEMDQIIIEKSAVRYYKKKDFTEESQVILYKNFAEGLVDDYLQHKAERESRVKILTNPALPA